MPVRERRIWLLSLLSGACLALAWPAVGGMTWLAFVAWVPLLAAEQLHDVRQVRRSFVLRTWPAMILWNASVSWWLGMVSEPWPTRLVAGMAPVLVNTALMSLPWLLKRMATQRIGANMGTITFVCAWLAMEHLHHDWDLQWPWLSLGNVFAEEPSWVQWYDITGIAGGTLWVWLVNLGLFHALRHLWNEGITASWRAAILPLALLALPVLFSRYRMHSLPEPVGSLEVVVVQPNVDPYAEKFGGVDPMEQLDRMLALAEQHVGPATDLALLPETALQEQTYYQATPEGIILHGLWENDLGASESARRIAGFIARHPQVTVLTGMSSARMLGVDERPGPVSRPLHRTGRWYESFNAAMLMDAHGTLQSYRKSKLVAGVELMPFAGVLGRLDGLAIDLGGTTGSMGTQPERSVLGRGRVRVAPAICYESVFGAHVAAHVANGATLIAIMTNDGWWDDTPGYRQHLAYGRLRAIETRRSIARSANTGVSCTIDPLGRVDHATPWWVPAAFSASLPLHDHLTFYVRHGDLIGSVALWAAVLMVLFTLLSRWLRLRGL